MFVALYAVRSMSRKSTWRSWTATKATEGKTCWFTFARAPVRKLNPLFSGVAKMAYYARRFAPRLGTAAKPQVTYPLVDVVAAACVAFHANGDKIEKYDASAVPERIYDDYTHPAVAAVISNKTRALAALEAGALTQADRDEAAEVIQHIQGQVTMGLLSGKKISDFVKELAKSLEEETVPSFKVGLLCYAPNVYHTAKVKEVITEQTTELLYTSKPLGPVDAKVTVNFTLIEKRYVQNFGCYSAYGKDDAGNLVSFLSKHEHLCESGKRVGKIKKAEADSWHGNAVVTSLNYVKAA